MSSSLYLIAGLGKTGVSIARYLQRRKKDFVFFDTREAPSNVTEIKAEFPTVDIFLRTIPDNLYKKLTEIIASPGVPLDHESIKKAIDKNIAVVSDIECLAREIKAPVVAITGTNGKSTVTTLVGDILKAAGKKVAVCGNIGVPVLEMLGDGSNYEVWVLELSSFQLEITNSLSPIAATILNVTPDHLDRHHTFEVYRQAKQRVYHLAKYKIYNRDDKNTIPEAQDRLSEPERSAGEGSPKAREMSLPTSARDRQDVTFLTSFGLDTPKTDQYGLLHQNNKTYLAYGNEIVLSVDELKIKGTHNWQNALAALALARSIGVKYHAIVNVLKTFTGLPHRSQLIRTIGEVEWINDSKGTNVGATLSSLVGIGEAIHGKIVLIAGGQGKGADFRALREPIKKYVRSMILIGEDAIKLESALEDVVNTVHAQSLKEAVEIARTKALPKDVVLLSPACASFDMFRDFNHRGESFAEAVQSL